MNKIFSFFVLIILVFTAVVYFAKTQTGDNVQQSTNNSGSVQDDIKNVPTIVIPNDTEIVSGDPRYSLGNEFTDSALVIEGDMLNINVGYGSCGKRREFEFSWSGFTESEPVKANVFISHDAGAACDAYAGDTLTYDLTEIKKTFQQAYYSEYGTILVNVIGFEGEKESILYTF